MRPANFEIVSGNNEVFEITLVLNIDLTDYTDPQMFVRASEDNPDTVLELTDGVGITIEDAVTGTVALYASEADVTDLRGEYVFDARATRDSKREVIFKGTIEFTQGKTYDLP